MLCCPGSHITTQLCNNCAEVPTHLIGLPGGLHALILYIMLQHSALTQGDSSHPHVRKIMGRGGRGKEGHARGKWHRVEGGPEHEKALGGITEFRGPEHFQQTSYRNTQAADLGK